MQKQAYLVIKDTGIGIAEEHLPHIFERFYRVDRAHVQTVESHSNLWLAIVEWVVQAHSGTLVAESRVGQGSTFTVTLPHQVLPSRQRRHLLIEPLVPF